MAEEFGNNYTGVMEKFSVKNFKILWQPKNESFGEDNGQITIVGGSELFTGAPLLSVISATRLVDMVFVATPFEDRTVIEKVKLFSKLRSVIWVPREELGKYIEKCNAILIGPGLMRYKDEGDKFKAVDEKNYDEAGRRTKQMTENLLENFPNKLWVIDGGSLQVIDTKQIPKGAILTPNRKEFQILFGRDISQLDSEDMVLAVEEKAREFECLVVYKAPVSVVSDGRETFIVDGGNAGLTKGGTGDVLAGVIVGLAAMNPPLLAAAAGSFLVKKTAEYLFNKVGYNYNADDLAAKVFEVFKELRG